jgi:hypothetical protein
MAETRATRRPIGGLVSIALAIVMPACHAPGGAPTPLVRSPDGVSSRYSLRPVLDGAGYRPYYVGGYAGASYGPGLFGRNTMMGVPAPPPPGPPNVTINQGTWEPQ